MNSFRTLKEKLISAPIIVAPDWGFHLSLCVMQAIMRLALFWVKERIRSSMPFVKPNKKMNFFEKWQNNGLWISYDLKTWNFSTSRMMKRTSPLDSSSENSSY